MIKTIIKRLPRHTVVILYDENFVKRQRALNSLRYHTRVIVKSDIQRQQTTLL